jgi:putative chitinase
MRTFPKYFPEKTRAIIYQRQPIAIASRVYANRMGNGDENSREGWKYRGRGYIMGTGKEFYERFGKFANIDLVSDPDLLLQPELAMRAAGWFWDKHKLNLLADKGTDDEVVKAITKVVNGGLNGIEDRLNRFAEIYQTIV